MSFSPRRLTSKQLAQTIVEVSSDPKYEGDRLVSKIRGCAKRIIELERKKEKK